MARDAFALSWNRHLTETLTGRDEKTGAATFSQLNLRAWTSDWRPLTRIITVLVQPIILINMNVKIFFDMQQFNIIINWGNPIFILVHTENNSRPHHSYYWQDLIMLWHFSRSSISPPWGELALVFDMTILINANRHDVGERASQVRSRALYAD